MRKLILTILLLLSFNTYAGYYVSWEPPTHTEDCTEIQPGDITGYVIHFGNTPDNLDSVETIAARYYALNPYEAPAKIYGAIIAVDKNGLHSLRSDHSGPTLDCDTMETIDHIPVTFMIEVTGNESFYEKLRYNWLSLIHSL